MRKYLTYLKPFRRALLVVFVLLAVQAVTELLLPNYMSDIVNVGIQQGGFEDGVPPELSGQAEQLTARFMTDGERELLAQSYDERGGMYILKSSVTEEDRTKLDDAFGMSEWTMICLMRELPETKGLLADSDSTSLAETDVSNLDMSKLSEALPYVLSADAAQIETARTAALKVPESTRSQTAAAFARIFAEQAGVDVRSIQSRYLQRTGFTMLGIALIAATAAIIVGYLASRVAAGAARRLRGDIFRRVEEFSLNEFHSFPTSSLITRTTNDVTQTQQFTVMAIRMLLFSPIMGIGGVIMALGQSTNMAWTILVGVGLLSAIVVVLFFVVLPKFRITQSLLDRVNLMSRENLTGMLVVRAFRAQGYEEERFAGAADDLGRTLRFTSRAMSAMMPAMMFVMNGLSLLIVWVGAEQVQNAGFQVGSIMAYIQYVMIIIMSFLMVAGMFIMIPRASVSLNRIFEVLETEPQIREPEHPEPFVQKDLGVVEFRNVSFSYPGAEDNVLDDISFTAEPGRVTAVIGPTGCGKTTLVGLIPRFYDATEGEVLVSGVNVKDADLHALRDEIGFVPQKGVLFSGTIASNLRYGAKDATDEDLKEVAQIAQAMEFIDTLPEKFAAPVSQGGTNVSGGQRQRLAIARALATRAPIYVFDDSFSALDAKTDAAARKALRPFTKNATTIIVAQKISSILDADQILVLEDGKIVGRGTHTELMKTCEPYREIARSQLGEDAV